MNYNVSTRAAVIVLLATLVPTTNGQCVVAASDWDDGTTQGWTLGSDLGGWWEFVATGGSPDGYMRFWDITGASLPKGELEAPGTYHGDYSLLSNPWFAFDARTEAGVADVAVAVFISGPGGEALSDLSQYEPAPSGTSTQS